MKKFLVNRVIFASVCLILIYPVIGLVIHEVNRFDRGIYSFFERDWSNLNNSSIKRYEVIKYIRDNTPRDSLFLVYRMSDFVYYSERKFIQHVDPLLIDLYKINDKEKAYRFLLGLGVDYIYVPNYSEPTYYSTQIYRITADPQLSMLEKESGGYQLYKLNRTDRKTISTAMDTGNTLNLITTRDNWKTLFRRIKGRKGPEHLNLQVRNVNANRFQSDRGDRDTIVVENRDGYNSYLYTGRGLVPLSPRNCFFKSGMEGGSNYRVVAQMKGQGLFHIYLLKYLPDNRFKRVSLWRSVLSDNYRTIERQFIAPSDAHEYRIMIHLKGEGHLALNKFQMEKVLTPDIPGNRKEIKKKGDRKWSTVRSSSFEDTEPNTLEISGWKNHCRGRDASWIWGLTTESRHGKYALYLKQQGSVNCWLYTGKRDIVFSASSFADRVIKRGLETMLRLQNIFRITNNNSSEKKEIKSAYRFSGSLKGEGYADLFVWFDTDGKVIRKYVGRYLLPEHYETLEEVVELPSAAEVKGIAFKLLDENKKISSLYLDDFRLESETLEDSSQIL